MCSCLFIYFLIYFCLTLLSRGVGLRNAYNYFVFILYIVPPHFQKKKKKKGFAIVSDIASL